MTARVGWLVCNPLPLLLLRTMGNATTLEKYATHYTQFACIVFTKERAGRADTQCHFSEPICLGVPVTSQYVDIRTTQVHLLMLVRVPEIICPKTWTQSLLICTQNDKCIRNSHSEQIQQGIERIIWGYILIIYTSTYNAWFPLQSSISESSTRQI